MSDVDIAIVEDDVHKRDALISLVSTRFPGAAIETAASYNSALKLVRQLAAGRGVPLVVLLDVSLPSFDNAGVGGSGGMRPFGGVELLRDFRRKGLSVVAVVVTQYDSYGNDGHKKDLQELRREIKTEYADLVAGFVSYRHRSSEWKGQLGELLERAVQTRGKGPG